MTVLDNKPTNSVEHLEENKFSVGCHQFLLDCCSQLIITFNFGQNTDNKIQIKTKKVFFSKWTKLFVNFLSAIVSIFNALAVNVS
jgi:hypothetical protein